MPPTSTPPAVLLDVDGTLVDSNYLHVLAWARSFAEHDVEVAMSAIHRHIGMGSPELMRELAGAARDELNDGHSQHYAPLRQELRRLPGARELLRETARRGARNVLATSAKPEDLEALRKVIDCDDAIFHITSSQDVEQAKPAPDIFLAGLRAAEAPRDRAVVLGDTVWDVKAAAAAGVPCVGVATGGISAQELREAGAVAVYDDCRDLLDHFDDSPLGELLRG